MEVKIVLGHTFGDEGKGVTVQWLCKKAIEEGKKPLVVRFSGGPQAAHTIFNGGTEHICSSFGSGVLLGVPTILYGDVFIDPICMRKEYEVLESKGIKPILVRGYNRIITPYDVIAGRKNTKVMKDGTCGKGIYTTFNRYEKSFNIPRFCDIGTDPNLLLAIAAHYYGMERDKEYDDMFRSAYLWMMTEIHRFLPMKDTYDTIILEGSQGLLLDMDNGFYPNVTPSKVGLNGVPETLLNDAEVYLVTRTYTTRHGNGYKPKDKFGTLMLKNIKDKYESNVTNEFQGNFKTGVLEVRLLNRAYERHCIDNYVKKYNMSVNLVVTHMDIPHIIHNDGFSVYCWSYIDNLNKFHYNITGKENILNTLTRNLVYVPNHIYYNESVESNIKQYK